MISLLAISTFLALLVALRNRNLFDPWLLTTLVFLGYIVLPAIWIAMFRQYSNYYFLYEHAFEKTLLVCLGFLLFCFLGTRLAQFSDLPQPSTNLSPSVLFSAGVLLILSAYSKIYLIQRGAFFLEDKLWSDGRSNVPALIQFFNNVHLIGLTLVAAYYTRSRTDRVSHSNGRIHPFALPLFVAIFLYSVGVAFLQGRRFGVVFPFLMALTILLARKRIRPSRVLISGGCLVALFFTMTLIRLAQAESFREDGGVDFGIVARAFDAEHIIDACDSLVSRVGNPLIIANHAIANRDDQSLGEIHNPFTLMAGSLIPRAVWPGKPSLSVGNNVGKELGLISESNHLTKINPGWIGESYLSHGTIGVAFAGLLFGLLTMLVFQAIDPQSDSGICILIQLCIFIVSGFQMEMAISVNNLFKGILLSLLLVVLHRQAESTQRTPVMSNAGNLGFHPRAVN